jgi:CheY-like chemotaxis protein
MARLLLVDDNDLLRSALQEYLSEFGHLVTAAPDGEIALSLFQPAAFDALITDIIMPQCDGLELMKAVRKADETIKIIAISGGGETMNVEHVLRWSASHGAQETLQKPFLPSSLAALIDRLLEDNSEPERLFA